LDYYVYIHKKADDGTVFYIGKGRKNRAWSKHNRNKYWHHIVAKHGLIVEIVSSNLEEKEAFSQECSLIKATAPIANLTLGGEGGNTFDKLSEDDKLKLREDARTRSRDPSGGVAKAARIRRGKNKFTDAGLRLMAEKNAINNSGSGNPMFGKSHWNNQSEEERLELKARISNSLKFHIPSLS
jgi:hypothetical protein